MESYQDNTILSDRHYSMMLCAEIKSPGVFQSVNSSKSETTISKIMNCDNWWQLDYSITNDYSPRLNATLMSALLDQFYRLCLKNLYTIEQHLIDLIKRTDFQVIHWIAKDLVGQLRMSYYIKLHFGNSDETAYDKSRRCRNLSPRKHSDNSKHKT